MIEQVYPIPAFSDNYIWIFRNSANNEACVVDPGDAAPVMDYLQRYNLTLSHILVTHHHADHTGGVDALSEKFRAVVYGPANSPFKAVNQQLVEGDTVSVFGVTFQILSTPGHTLDHIAYYSDRQLGLTSGSPVLFCGDTLFAAGCGRIFEGTAPMLFASLQKLAILDPDTRVYCTHEYTLANLKFASAADPENSALKQRIKTAMKTREEGMPTLPSSIALELATNPFLRCDQPALISSAASREQEPIETATEVFASLRQWKDNF